MWLSAANGTDEQPSTSTQENSTKIEQWHRRQRQMPTSMPTSMGTVGNGQQGEDKGIRRSLYQSLPLYWQKGWRTHGGPLSSSTNNDDQQNENGSAAAANSKTKKQPTSNTTLITKPLNQKKRRRQRQPSSSSSSSVASDIPATTDLGHRRPLLFSQKCSEPQSEQSHQKCIPPSRRTGKKSDRRFSNGTDGPWPKHQIRHGRLILLALISGSILLLLISLFLIIGPEFLFPQQNIRPRIIEEFGANSGGNSQQHFFQRLKTAYSEVHPLEEEQIWLLNTNEFIRRQKRQALILPKSASFRDPFLFGLARLCGLSCSVQLKHGIGKQIDGTMGRGEMLRIKLSRWKTEYLNGNKDQRRRRRRSLLELEPPSISAQKLPNSFIPLIQTMDSANQTQIRRSNISPSCFYFAKVGEGEEQSVINLCDRNGGLFGTLALPNGAFLIEPLVDENRTENGNQQKRRKRRFAGGGTQLRAHLIYPVRTQHFGDDQQEGKQKATSNNGRPSESEELAMEERRFWMERKKEGKNGHQNESEWEQMEGDAPFRRSRRSNGAANSWDHYVEVLAVADYRMLLYHQQNLENYVLTLFSTVSSIYRHPSLGVSVNIIVVRLVILKNEQAGPLISNRAQETLQQFCQWQQLYNDRNDESLNHHDVAILLTRHDICRATNKCDTLGLAELGTMCDAKRSCAIIEDNGLSAAFTIAHELGHIFNIPHDDERKCGEHMPLNKANYHIMAPTLEYNTNPWSWSACSSAMLIRFLDTRRGQTQCILDQPVERRFYEKMFETPAPGAIYSVSQQCKFVFGASAEICPYMPSCRRLWCSVSYGYQLGCRTQHMPWADGTECGQQMWCYRGQCVGMSPQQRQPLDGGWGEWKEWMDCSRTCGGGVQKAYRDCDSPRPENGGKYCTGQGVRYRPCNIQDCPWDMPGFREQQCSEFDGKDIGIHGVPSVGTRWVPKYTGVAENERCKLQCRAADSAAFYLLKEKVVDGTPCDRHGDDICIDGACHKAGCDHRLGSDMKRDICGVCGGDGGSCREFKGIYNDRGTFGYNEVLRIPAGAANIDISQQAHNGQTEDDNYLALRLANGEWLLNGQYQVSVFRQQIPILDAVLEYSGSETTLERINGTGPLRSDVYLHVLSVGQLNPPNIHYRFMDPIMPQEQRAAATATTHQLMQAPGSFYWRQIDQWSECSLKCQGIQSQHLICTDALNNRQTNYSNCAHLRRPDLQQRMCNVDCFYKWQQRLNADSSGRRWYQNICVRSFTNGREEQANEDECLQAGVNGPISRQNGPHQVDHIPAGSTEQQQQSAENNNKQQQSPPSHIPTDRKWAYSEWSQCSESCGTGGIRQRSLHCIDIRNGRKLDNRFCDGIAHEPAQTECNRTPCPRWAHGQWGECSRSCGGGIRLRHVACQDASGREVNPSMCSAQSKIADSEKCNEQECTEWRFGVWSQCSVSCGQGVQRREASCVNTADGGPVEESECDPRQKIVEKQCELAGCPQWKLGSWSQCSVSCGADGFQTRLVQCVDSADRKLPDQLCLQKSQGGNGGEKGIGGELRPQRHKVCAPGPCPYWRTSDWGQCSVSCGQGLRERRVECVHRDQPVDDSICSEVTKPPKQNRCVLLACAFWNTEPWGQCSATCGWGVQRRVINCVRQMMGGQFINSITNNNTNRSIVVHDRECSTQKPKTERSCERLSCPAAILNGGAHWETSSWGQCGQKGECKNGENGTQKRTVECRNAQRLLPGPFCSHLERPKDSQPCECPKQQIPAILARDDANGNGQNDGGKNSTKMNENQKMAVDFAKWESGEWSQCSVSCGVGGWRRRSVFCAIQNSTSSSVANPILNSNLLRCPEAEKPSQFEQCNGNKKCPKADEQNGRLNGSSFSIPTVRNATSNSSTTLIPNEKSLVGISTNATKSIKSDTFLPDNVENTAGMELSHPRWESGPWSICPRNCASNNQSLNRTRRIRCVDSMSGRELDPTKCPANSRPSSEHRCHRQTNCPKWHKGEWELCSSSCGPGITRRDVFCTKGRTMQSSMMQKVPDAECMVLEPRPFETRKCELGKCPKYGWRVGPWSKCADPCKPSEQKRRVYCMSDQGKRAATKMCQNETKIANSDNDVQPRETRKCPTDKCPYHWVAGSWSTCSRTCGSGFHFRRLECRVRRENPKNISNSSIPSNSESSENVSLATGSAADEPTVLSRMCMALEKPIVTKQCQMNPCNAEFHWNVGPWSQCSKNCGHGFRRRKVRCLDRLNGRAAREKCDEKNRPRRREGCFLRNCLPGDCAELKAQQEKNGRRIGEMLDGNYTILVTGYRVEVYCHRMNETIPKTYLNVQSQSNFAEFYGKRLVYPYSCPHDGRRNDSCACTNDGHVGQGRTKFRKIRVDLHNMKINPNDHTFSTTDYGSPVAYGTAGDCYSMSDCPQGHFSIDLRGTRLRLVDDLQWTDQGHRTSSRIERSENNALVQGFCGGYCGECAPDRFKGLVLEVDQRQSPHIGIG